MLPVHFLVFDGAIIVASKLAIIDGHLRLPDKCAIALSTGLLRHEDIEALRVVNALPIVHMLYHVFANIGHQVAHNVDSTVRERHGCKPVIVAKFVHNTELDQLNVL